MYIYVFQTDTMLMRRRIDGRDNVLVCCDGDEGQAPPWGDLLLSLAVDVTPRVRAADVATYVKSKYICHTSLPSYIFNLSPLPIPSLHPPLPPTFVTCPPRATTPTLPAYLPPVICY